MIRLLQLSLPILLASVVSAVNHLTDRYFLAQAGDGALEAVLPAGMLASLLTLLASTSIGYVESFVAQHHGANRRDEAVRSFSQGLLLVLAVSPIFLLACPAGIALLDAVGHPERVLAAEKTYFRYLQPAGILTVLSTVLGAFFTGQGKTRLVSACGMLGAAANILLDRILILGLHFDFSFSIFSFQFSISPHGIAGAGLATVLSNTLPCLVLAVAVWRDPLIPERRRLRLLVPDLGQLSELIRFGLPSGLNALLGAAAFTVFTLALGKTGSTELAVSTAAFSLNNVFVLAETALAQAVTIAAARAYGEGKFAAVRPVIRSGLILALAFALLFLLAIAPFSDIWLRGFAGPDANLPVFLSIGRILVRILIVRTIADAVLTVYLGTLRGLGDTRFLVFVRTGTDVLVWLPTVFLVMKFHPTVTALWATMPIPLILSAAILRFRLSHQNRIRTILR